MGFCYCSMFFGALLCVHSSFAIILMGKRELVALLSFVFLVSRDCCVALLRGATGLSAGFDCGISLSYSLCLHIKFTLSIRIFGVWLIQKRCQVGLRFLIKSYLQFISIL